MVHTAAGEGLSRGVGQVEVVAPGWVAGFGVTARDESCGLQGGDKKSI